MNKVFLTLAAAVMVLTASATPTVLNPVADYSFRTNGTVSADQQEDPTGWNSADFPKTAPETVECTYSSKMWGQQMYDVTDIDWTDVESVSMTLFNQNGATYRLGAWMYPDADWTDSAQQAWTEGQCPIVENFKSVVGAYPGHQTTSKTYLAYADEGNTDTLKVKQVITFSGEALTTLKNSVVTKGEKKYLNFIITFRETDASISSRKVVYYALNTTEEGKQPVLTISYAEGPETPVVTNLTTGQDYKDLATAVAAADSADVLQLNEDVTVSGSRIENSVALTIQGKTGAEKILRDTKLDNLVFLPKAELTFKGLVIDGQNVNRKKAAVEASNTKVIFDSVTIQNFQRTDDGQTQGVITIKSKGKAVLNNVTFSNNAVLAGYGDVFVGLNKALTLSGNNTIPNGIYIEKDTFAIIDDSTSHTVAIDLRVPDTRQLGEEYPIVIGTTDTGIYNLIATNPNWSLEAGESFLYVKENATGLPSLLGKDAESSSTTKQLKDGHLIIIRDGVRYNAQGARF